jgi:hypothetical protein
MDLKREALQAKIRTLEGYLKMKMEDRDWHGVADAACDLRVLEAHLEHEPFEVSKSTFRPL